MLVESLLCLALNIFHEARSEPIESQIGVAAVTVNRSRDKGYPSSICKVVYEPSAFSWTSSKAKRSIKDISQIKGEEDKKAFLQAKRIADLYLKGKIESTVGSRKYFNHKSMGKRYNTPYKPIRFDKLVYY